MSTSLTLDLPPCRVVAKNLSLQEITRMTVSPFFVSHKCGRCQKITYHGPKCNSCSTHYHFNCATKWRICCGSKVLSFETEASCPKCKKKVYYGPECFRCGKKYHSFCITPFQICCGFNLCELREEKQCGMCRTGVILGPRCPLCGTLYHPRCVHNVLPCCAITFRQDEDNDYKCCKCFKSVLLGAPICQFCGSIFHKRCVTSCCGRRVPLEVYVVPSFNYLLHFYDKIKKRHSKMKKLEELVVNNNHKLRTVIKEKRKRVRKRTSACQTEKTVDDITIVSVKSETEDNEVEIESPPPLLEREDSCTPEPSSSSSHRPSSSMESDESLKTLFDFLYNMVKKFPPHLQTQVKVDLFKTVTEAEMKLRCNVLECPSINGRK